MGFERTFSGLPGEDPAEYVEDVELDAEVTHGGNVETKEKACRSYFRKGLREEAYKWYRKQSEDDRQDWGRISQSFRDRFKTRRTIRDRGLAIQVNSFSRRSGEGWVDYLKRATKLADECDATLQNELRNRFVNHFMDNGNEADEAFLLRIVDRLEFRGLTDADGFFKPNTTFDQLREVVIQTARKPGRDDNPFYVDDEDAGGPGPATTEKTLMEMTKTLQAMTHHMDRSMVPTAYGTPSNSSYNQTQPLATNGNQSGEAVAQPFHPPTHHMGYNQQVVPYSATVQGNGPSTHARRPSFGATRPPRVVGPCWNCGAEGHRTDTCIHPQQPWKTREAIRSHCMEGKAIPDELKYPVATAANSNATQPTTADVKIAVPARGWSTGQDNQWENLPSNEAWKMTLPGMFAGERKRTRRTSPDREADEEVVMRDAAPVLMPTGERPRRRNASPHPNQVQTQGLKKAKEDLRTLKSIMQDAVDKKRHKTDTIPTKVMAEDLDKRFSVSKMLHETSVTMSWAQLLDRSPQLRRQMADAMGLAISSRRGGTTTRRKEKTHTRGRSMLADADQPRATVVDQSRPDSMETHLGYVVGLVNDEQVDRCLLDDGSLIDLISPETVNKLGITPVDANPPMEMKMADDSTALITQYVLFPLVVGGIVSMMRAWITGSSDSYDILLSRCWLKRNAVTINYERNEMSMRGVNGNTAMVQIATKPTTGLGEAKPAPDDGKRVGPARYHSYIEDADESSGSDSEDEEDALEEGLTLEAMMNVSELIDIAEYAERQVQDQGEHKSQSKNS